MIIPRPERAAKRVVLAVAVFWLIANVGIADQSSQQKPDVVRPVIRVYFNEPLKLLEPFKDFQRSCTCVERAFALIPRVVSDNPGPAAPLRPGDAVLRVIHDAADALWLERGNTPPEPRMLITGRGMRPLDGEAAIKAGIGAYRKLAASGDPAAQAELGYLYAVGIGVDRSDEWAAYWYGQAAQRDWPDAKLAIAAMYALGRGVSQDDQAAAYWLTRSEHSRFLADAYACGLGVEQDFERARQLYEVMGGRSDPDAQYTLGTMYLNGCGAAHDDDLAGEWLSKAANLGHPEAQIALAEMMIEGWVRNIRDPWTAYLMADLAWRRLPADDPSRGRAESARDRAAAMLSAEQLAWVRRSAEAMIAADAEAQAEWLKTNRRLVRTKR